MKYRNLILKTCRPPITNEEIVEFQEKFHCNLPSTYIQFLRKANGGMPDERTCRYESDVELPGGNEFDITSFLPLLKGAAKVISVEEITEYFVEVLPPDGILIALDDFANYVGVHTDSSRVFWLCCDKECEQYYLCAIELNVDFDVFIKSLGPVDY